MSFTMTDLNFPNGFIPDSQRELLCSNSSIDELQLAALLGKTLLENNSELELKLRKLQEFAEDTLAINQNLKRQLSESKDSLQFSNKTCEQLEAKVEELEKANVYLQRHVNSQQMLIEHKAQKIQALEDDLAGTRGEYEKLQDQHRHLVADSTSIDNMDCISIGSSRLERSGSSCLDCVSMSPSPETEKMIGELTDRVRILTYQKEKAEKKLEEALAENESLDKNLEKAELEIDDLAKKLNLIEDPLVKQSSPSMPVSTTKHFLSTSTPTIQPAFSLPETLSPNSYTPDRSSSGVSLFNELDSQFSSLQGSYNSLVEGCTCSASLHHRSWSSPKKAGQVATTEKRKRNVSVNTPFKELFDEMFANLKQSAKVADRLVERKVIASED